MEGLIYGGKFFFKIDWASLIVSYFVFEGNFQVQAYIWRGDLTISCYPRLEIFVPILAKFSVPSFQSLISSSISRSFGSHFCSRVLVRIWPFAEEWVLGEFFPLKNKFLQALSFLLICDLHAFTSFFCKIFPCTFTLCFMHTEFAVLHEKLSIFVENFLAGKRIIARYDLSLIHI